MARKAPPEPKADVEVEDLTPEQIKVLKAELIKARDEVTRRLEGHVQDALDESTALPDEVDQASNVVSRAFSLRLADKEQKLIRLIQHALNKIDDGDYGICEGTGEPIPFKRLELRPWARYSVEYKQLLEKERALHADDRD